MAWVPGFEEKFNDYMSGRLTGGTARSMRLVQTGEHYPDIIENAPGYVYDNLPRLRQPVAIAVTSPPQPMAIAQARAAAAKARK